MRNDVTRECSDVKEWKLIKEVWNKKPKPYNIMLSLRKIVNYKRNIGWGKSFYTYRYNGKFDETFASRRAQWSMDAFPGKIKVGTCFPKRKNIRTNNYNFEMNP